jgi:hypothetical protein
VCKLTATLGESPMAPSTAMTVLPPVAHQIVRAFGG